VTTDIAGNLHRVRERIEKALDRSGRPGAEVVLVAVTKTLPVETVSRAIAAGQLEFGENRIQEAEGKIPHLAGTAPVRWHLIGHLQSNKARRAAELFDMIHSVDSAKLAGRLDQACAALGKVLPVLLQVDLGEEETKFGVSRAGLRDLARALSECRSLKLNGLMTIPPFLEDPEQVRPFFRELRRLRDSLEQERPGCLGDGHLSMGMTHDLEAAILEGATIVRVGTAIFGERAHG